VAAEVPSRRPTRTSIIAAGKAFHKSILQERVRTKFRKQKHFEEVLIYPRMDTLLRA
jgi:hypothetical protein